MGDDEAAEALARLHEILKNRAAAKDLSTQELARQTGMSRTTVTNALNDRHRPPTRRTIRLLAEKLDFSSEAILKLEALRQRAEALRPPKPEPEPDPLPTHPVSNLRPLKPEPFVGRHEAVAKLTALPASGAGLPPVTVRGMGGVGKSTLALHHAWWRKTQGCDPVWWVEAENRGSVEAGLAALAGTLDPERARTLTTAEAAAWAAHRLEAGTNWTLVFDNVEDAAAVQPWLGRLSTGLVLITTRRVLHWQRGAGFVDLAPLDHDIAVDLLKELTGRTDDAAAGALTALAEELGDLPLALRQAGAYIAQTQTEPAEYLKLLRQQPARLLDRQPPVDDGEQQTIARLWSVTLSTLGRTHPDAVALLRVLAHCAPQPLPRDVLDGALSTPLDVAEALGVLAAYSLVTLTAEDVTVHRLLQAVLRTDTAAPVTGAADQRGPWTAAVVLLECAAPAATDPHDVTVWPRWERLVPHVETVAAYRQDHDSLPELAELMGRAGSYLTGRGRLTRALELKEPALDLSRQLHGQHHPDTLRHLNSLAVTLNNAGQYALAEPMHREACRISREIHGERDLITAGSLGNLAHSLTHQGHHQEALELSRKALDLFRRARGEEHPDTAAFMDRLATVHAALGQHHEALVLEQRALHITEAALGEGHPDTALRLGNLAAFHSALGDHRQALILEQRALRVTRTALGDDHPYTADCLGNLAETLRETGHYKEALKKAQEALRVTEEAYGSRHPDTATRLGNLARLLTGLGKYEQALPLDERALEIAQDALGTQNPDTALRHSTLAQSLRRAGRLEEALPHAQRARDIATDRLPSGHADRAAYANGLGTILDELGQHAEALTLKSEALQTAEQALGPDHPVCAAYASNLAVTLHRLGRYDEALRHAQRAVDITLAAFDPDHPELPLRLHNLAQTLLSLGRRKEGLDREHEAVELAERVLGEDHPMTAHLQRRYEAAKAAHGPGTGSRDEK